MKKAAALAIGLSILGCDNEKTQVQVEKEACQRELSWYNRNVLHRALIRASNGNCIDSKGTTVGPIEKLEIRDSRFCESPRDDEELIEFSNIVNKVKGEILKLCPEKEVNLPELSFEPVPPAPKVFRGGML